MATTVSYGKCAKCGDNNAKTAESCRKCNAPLPWSKTASKPAAKSVKSSPSKSSAVKSQIDWGMWSVGVFSFLIPIIGYFLYRSYSENGSEKASAAGWGAALGVLFHIARIALKMTVA